MGENMELNNKNTAIIVIVIIIIAIASIGTYYFFIYDNSTEYTFDEVSFKSHDKIVFNDSESDFNNGFSYYNGNKTTVKIFNLNKSDSASALGYELAIKNMREYPSETYNNRVIHTSTANVGEYVGEVRYMTFIEDNNKNVVVDISSDNKDEVFFIADSLKILL